MIVISAGVGLRVWSHSALLPVVICGQLSYSIYLLHAFFYRFVGPPHTLFAVLNFLVLSFGTAIPFFLYIESSGIRRMPSWTRPFGVRR